MNNANAKTSGAQARKQPVQIQSNSQPPVAVRPDDVMRDFFRRGDRGQYEGGASDRAIDSIPTWDLPERRQIVRTPQQQARRATLMRVEAFLMAACLVLLVTAARSKLIGGSQPRQTARDQAAHAMLVAASNAMPPAPPAVAVGTAEPPKMANPSPANPASTNAPAVPTSAPQVASTSATQFGSASAKARPVPVTPTPALAARPRQAAQSQSQPAPVSAGPVAAPRRAVAAFPDD